MSIYSDNIKPILKRKDILIRLILINAGVFLLLSLLNIGWLFEVDLANTLVRYLAVPARLDVLPSRFWTVLTYMFVHQNFLHILFNMLIFYWFGKIFLTSFNSKNLLALYILGGLAGAAIYILAFNTVPALVKMNSIPMIGASASVMAIIFGIAFYRPNYEIGLLLLGRIKIVYIALILFVLDFIGIGNNPNTEMGMQTANTGGHIAHIGGAILGYVYAKLYLKGRDITRWFNKTIDFIVNIFKPSSKPKMKAKYNKRENDYDYNQRRNNTNEEIDRILDKIKKSGYSSLSKEEKKQLFDASKK